MPVDNFENSLEVGRTCVNLFENVLVDEVLIVEFCYFVFRVEGGVKVFVPIHAKHFLEKFVLELSFLGFGKLTSLRQVEGKRKHPLSITHLQVRAIDCLLILVEHSLELLSPLFPSHWNSLFDIGVVEGVLESNWISIASLNILFGKVTNIFKSMHFTKKPK